MDKSIKIETQYSYFINYSSSGALGFFLKPDRNLERIFLEQRNSYNCHSLKAILDETQIFDIGL